MSRACTADFWAELYSFFPAALSLGRAFSFPMVWAGGWWGVASSSGPLSIIRWHRGCCRSLGIFLTLPSAAFPVLVPEPVSWPGSIDLWGWLHPLGRRWNVCKESTAHFSERQLNRRSAEEAGREWRRSFPLNGSCGFSWIGSGVYLFSLGRIFALKFIGVKKEIIRFWVWLKERRCNEFQECVWTLIHLYKGYKHCSMSKRSIVRCFSVFGVFLVQILEKDLLLLIFQSELKTHNFLSFCHSNSACLLLSMLSLV